MEHQPFDSQLIASTILRVYGLEDGRRYIADCIAILSGTGNAKGASLFFEAGEEMEQLGIGEGELH